MLDIRGRQADTPQGAGPDADLAHRSIDAARVQCLGSPRPHEAFHGGPVLGDGPIDRRLRHNRAGQPVDGFDDEAAYPNRLAGEWAYGGFVYPHFGHCMAELVHRIVPSRRRYPGCRFLFAGAPSGEPTSGFEHIPGFMQDILTFLDLSPDDVTVVNQNTVVERLHIVEQGADLGGSPKPGYLDELRRFALPRMQQIADPAAPIAGQVYVSRSALPPGGGFLGERYIEGLLQAAGFTLFRPELHPFAKQIEAYRNARTLIFAEGSACHGVELFGGAMLQRCLLLVRRPEVGTSFELILAPRSQSYAAHFGAANLGTIVAHPNDGSPLLHLAVSVFDVPALGAFLQAHTGIAPDAIDAGRYARDAMADFDAYVAYHRTRSQLLPDEAVASVVQRARSALAGMLPSAG